MTLPLILPSVREVVEDDWARVGDRLVWVRAVDGDRLLCQEIMKPDDDLYGERRWVRREVVEHDDDRTDRWEILIRRLINDPSVGGLPNHLRPNPSLDTGVVDFAWLQKARAWIVDHIDVIDRPVALTAWAVAFSCGKWDEADKAAVITRYERWLPVPGCFDDSWQPSDAILRQELGER